MFSNAISYRKTRSLAVICTLAASLAAFGGGSGASPPVALDTASVVAGSSAFVATTTDPANAGERDGLPDMVFVTLNSRMTSGIGRASSRDHGSQWRRWQLRRRQ
jgi:hypothetical protein